MDSMCQWGNELPSVERLRRSLMSAITALSEATRQGLNVEKTEISWHPVGSSSKTSQHATFRHAMQSGIRGNERRKENVGDLAFFPELSWEKSEVFSGFKGFSGPQTSNFFRTASSMDVTPTEGLLSKTFVFPSIPSQRLCWNSTSQRQNRSKGMDCHHAMLCTGNFDSKGQTEQKMTDVGMRRSFRRYSVYLRTDPNSVVLP